MAAFVCSDLHGCLEFYDAVNSVIGPEDVVYFLGDAGDRGPQPWETIKKILENPQWIYLKGNHEDMLLKCLRYTVSGVMGRYDDYALLHQNGGSGTLHEAEVDPDLKEIFSKLNTLPLTAEYTNPDGVRYIMSHAGFTPWVGENNKIIYPSNEDLIWDREHFYDDWPEDEVLKNTVIIHGHTPTPYVARKYLTYEFKDVELEPGLLRYCGNHKIDMDSGAVFTDYFSLLNLDTGDEYVFEASEKEDN